MPHLKRTPLFIALAVGLGQGALAQSFPAEIDPADLDGTNGFILTGEAQQSPGVRSVSEAGDFNGDGIDDLIIGLNDADSNDDGNVGRSYVLFGASGALPNVLNLGNLDGLNGFFIDGEEGGSLSGESVSAAGDINGDGIDDLIIGAPGFDANGNSAAGRSYVLFGATGRPPNPFNLSGLDGSNGFVLNGENTDDRSGHSVSTAGDINGDGIDDLIIGAQGASPDGNFEAGRSYVVFGVAGGLSNPFNLSSLDGSNGFVLNGEADYDRSGVSVSAAGDVNGDGIDDLIIGAPFANDDGIESVGRSYLVFGAVGGLPNPFELSSLNGLNGSVINGEAENDRSGGSVSAAGDVNGDGIDDLVIGAPYADSGRVYVVFGSDNGLSNPLDLGLLNGSNGFIIDSTIPADRLGQSVSAAGDINGDGFDDLIVGASLARVNDGTAAGRSYVVFGSANVPSNPFDLSNLDGSNGFVISGETIGERLGRSVSGAGDINGDGIDDLVIDAPFAFFEGSRLGNTYVIFGRRIIDEVFVDRFQD